MSDKRTGRRLLSALRQGWHIYAHRTESKGFWKTSVGRLLHNLTYIVVPFCFLVLIVGLLIAICSSIIETVAAEVRSLGIVQSVAWVVGTIAIIILIYKTRHLLWRFARKIFLGLLEALYYITATAFYGALIAGALSLLAYIGNGLESFLTAPIGIKQDYVDTGFGSMWWVMFIFAGISGVIFYGVRKLRDETRVQSKPLNHA